MAGGRLLSLAFPRGFFLTDWHGWTLWVGNRVNLDGLTTGHHGKCEAIKIFVTACLIFPLDGEVRLVGLLDTIGAPAAGRDYVV